MKHSFEDGEYEIKDEVMINLKEKGEKLGV